MDSNHLPPRYQHGALPVELAALDVSWQGRKDSNPRPSVLETDALTRLSYAPGPVGKSTVPPRRDGLEHDLGLAEGLFAEGQVV